MVLIIPGPPEAAPDSPSAESAETAPPAGTEETYRPDAGSSQTLASAHSSVLFANTIEVSRCDSLTSSFDHELAEGTVLNNFRVAGGHWQDLAEQVEREVPAGQQKQTLFFVRDVLCQRSKYAIDEGQCEALGESLNAGMAVLSERLGALLNTPDFVPRHPEMPGRATAIELLAQQIYQRCSEE